LCMGKLLLFMSDLLLLTGLPPIFDDTPAHPPGLSSRTGPITETGKPRVSLDSFKACRCRVDAMG
jgi:hypothetical protein